MKYCPDQDIRLEATDRLAFNHCEMGRKEIGRRIYESLPPMYFCRELSIWWALDYREKLENARDRIRKGYNILCNALYHLRHAQGLSNEERIKIYEKGLALDDLFGMVAIISLSAIWGKRGHIVNFPVYIQG